MFLQHEHIRRQLVLVGCIPLVVGSADVNVQSPPAAQRTVRELSCTGFSAATSEASLVERFGKANVIRDSVVGFDDGPQPGTVLFPNDSAFRAEVFWYDPGARTRPRAVLVKGKATGWTTRNGIAVNSSLRDLERLNGRAFSMSGFWREGGIGGMVLSWRGGALELPQPGGCRLHIQLQPPYDGSTPQEVFRQVASGPSYSSDHPALQRINPRVVSLSLLF